MATKTMYLGQTAEQSDLGPHCLLYRLLRSFNEKISEQNTIVMNGGKRVNPLPASHTFCLLLSHLLKFLSSLFCKQYGPRSDYSL